MVARESERIKVRISSHPPSWVYRMKGPMKEIYVSRDEARRGPCSECGAVIGQHCIDRNGKARRSSHMVRHQLAIREGRGQ